MKYKYPRTYHLPWSPGATNDDKILHNLSFFEGKKVIVTEKMDGENTTIYPDGYTHARSIDSKNHASRSWVKQLASSRFNGGLYDHDDWRICGENLFAKHSIEYNNLDSYFYMFSFWCYDECMDWEVTKKVAEINGLTLVPVMYEGIFDIVVLKALETNLKEGQEGFVVRLADRISPEDWSKSVAKWVRPNHVQTDKHWMHKEIVKNKLKG